jgi:hypothetical protein
MSSLLATTITAGAMATVALGLAGQATAATPSGSTNATVTVNALKAQGFNVIVNRVGAAPLSACSVSAVRPGHDFIRTDSGFPGDTLATVVVSKTVQVDLTC